MLVRAAAAISAACLALQGAALAGEPGGTVPIDCGGYDADGALVHPEAATISTAPVDADGRVLVPAVCGGYNADGLFIGDD